MSALIIQLRTGKIGFRAFLHSRKVPGIDSPNCDCGDLMTVTHVVLRCPRWTEARAVAFAGIDERSLRSLKGLMATRKGCLAAARMVQQTELLAQFQSADLGGEEKG